MKRAKACGLRLILGLGLVLMGAQAAWALGFTYEASGVWTQWDGQVSNGASTDGPEVNRGGGSYNVETTPFTVAASVASGGDGTIAGATVSVGMVANASGFSGGAEGSGWAYSTAATLEPTVTDGIFYRITGGANGTPVKVLYSWSASLTTGDGGSASFGYGPGPGPLAITCSGNPDPQVWTHGGGAIAGKDSETGEYSNLTDGDNGAFMAHIGDIIGIFLGVDARVDFSRAGDFYAHAENTMNLEVQAVPVPGAVWLLGSGLLGLAGLRRFRKGWPAIPQL
jgi:hypothetical protein